MRAMRADRFGGYGDLQLTDIAKPIRAEGRLLVRMTAEEWDSVIDLNLRGAFLVTKAVMRPMMKQRAGRIVNVSSVAGVAGNAGQANYASAKAGLIGFTKTVAREMAVRNITCNAVAPGFVDTDLTHGLLKQMEETILKQIPLGRFGAVERGNWPLRIV